MTVIDGYFEAANQNQDLLKSKQSRGRNYSCPDQDCILTFPSEDTMKEHLKEELHVKQDEFEVQSTTDRVKKAWVSGLGGKVALRKTG